MNSQLRHASFLAKRESQKERDNVAYARLQGSAHIVGRTQYKLGGLDGGKSLSQMMNGNSVPTVDAPPNAENATADEDADKGHAIDQMSDTKIPPVGNAGTSTQKPIEQGSNNGN